MQIEDANNPAGADAGDVRSVEDVRLRSRREGLMLQRARILQEMQNSKNMRYRKLLEEMLTHLELELQIPPEDKIVNRHS